MRPHASSSVPVVRDPKRKPKRRRPHEAQTDWARWAHRQMDRELDDRVARKD